MEDKSKSLPIINLALIAILGVWVVHQRPSLDSKRPSAGSSETNAIVETNNKVWSRLWQDPFEAIHHKEHTLFSHSDRLSLQFLTNELSEHASDSQIAILAAMLPGSPYPEDAEVRRRQRYALETAVLVQNFGPEDQSHISVDQVDLSEGLSPPSKLAYEWFLQDSAATNKVLTLWLNEQDFQDRPLEKVSKLLEGIHFRANPNFQFYLLGMRSDTLHTMLREVAGWSTNAGTNFITSNTVIGMSNTVFAASNLVVGTANVVSGKFNVVIGAFNKVTGISSVVIGTSNVLGVRKNDPVGKPKVAKKELNKNVLVGISNRFHILLTEATAADTSLLDQTNWPTIVDLPRSVVKTNFGAAGLDVESWIASDEQLGRLVSDEIRNRLWNKRPLHESERILIITEQDSFYGRSLQDAVVAGLTNGTSALCPLSNNVWQLSYLRGLDGFKATNGVQAGQSSEIPATPEGLLEAALTEKGNAVDGDTQLDYADRLAVFAESRDEALHQVRGRIVAVGLTGNDVYDKLVLLQALRKRLPGAVFFTTDLDSRLWTPDALKYTRGLVVASGYGLDPETETNQFMPFRDVYQTAMYKATAAALRKLTKTNSLLAADTKDLRGQLFLIGRNDPVLLDKSDDYVDAICIAVGVFETAFGGLLAFIMFFGSEKWKRYYAMILVMGISILGLWFGLAESSSRYVADAIGMALGGFLVFMIYRFLFFRSQGWKGFYTTWIIIGVVTAGLFFGLAEWVSNRNGEEPWNFSGVSMWPCEFGRLLVLILSLFFCITARQLYVENLKMIRKVFGAKPRRSFVNAFSLARSGFPCVYLRIHVPLSLSFKLAKIFRRPKSASISNWHFPLLVNKKLGWFEDAIRRVQDSRIPLGHAPKPRIDAQKLLDGFAERAALEPRLVRIIKLILGLPVVIVVILIATHHMPDRLCIRGEIANIIDVVLLISSVLVFLVVVFYVVDSTRLTDKLLDALGDHRTAWPLKVLEYYAIVKGVRMEHLDGWLDVKFAALKTQEAWKLLIWPFLLLFLLMVSRNTYFDSWTWPKVLVAIFLMNFVIVAVCWAKVRRMANKVRQEALKELEEDISIITASDNTHFSIPTSEGRMAPLDKQSYVKRLKKLRQEIESNREGAFANWIQDPAYLAVFIPTGTGTILIAILEHWFTQ